VDTPLPIVHECEKILFSQTPILTPSLGVNVKKFSELVPLLQVTVIALSFVKKMLKRNLFQPSTVSRPMAIAELFWVRSQQRQFYSDVLTALHDKKKHDLVCRLGLFLDEDSIIRCAHHLQNANVLHGEKFPILMSCKLYFTTLLIRYFHSLVCHQGTSYTLHSLRREYWIPQGRAAVSSVVCQCTQCKRFIAHPFPQPQDSQLPHVRLTERSQPFSHVGVDTFGPLLIEDCKFYVLLITNLICRAINLELLCDMTTDELSFAYNWFALRCRQPQFIVSDNAKQFILLHGILLSSLCSTFEWKLIPEYSAWQGGSYERIVGLTKQSLFRTFQGHLLNGQTLSEMVLRTVLVEILGMLNSRPLTYIGEDHKNIPLSPNDFLHASFLSWRQPEIVSIY